MVLNIPIDGQPQALLRPRVQVQLQVLVGCLVDHETGGWADEVEPLCERAVADCLRDAVLLDADFRHVDLFKRHRQYDHQRDAGDHCTACRAVQGFRLEVVC